MLRLIPIVVLGAMLAPAVTLTPGERQRAMSELHASRKLLLDAMANLSEAQMKWKPAADRWSLAQLADHLALTEDHMLSLYRKAASSPADPARKSAQKDEEVLASVRDRKQKMKAPEVIEPKEGYANSTKRLADFRTKRDQTIALVEATQDQDLRHKILPDFEIDAYQVYLLLAAHTERHLGQIAETKAAPGFPTK